MADELQEKYGVPIVNKRVSVTPVADVAGSDDPAAYVEIAHALDAAAEEVGIDFIGGFSALVQKGFTRSDAALIEAIPEAIGATRRVCSSVNVASTRAGINMDAVVRMADVLLAVAKRTAADDSIGCAKIVVFCNVPEDNPFMAGALHGSGEPEVSVNVAISGPGVVRNVVAAHPEASLIELADLIKRTTFKITRVGELVAREASEMLGAADGHHRPLAGADPGGRRLDRRDPAVHGSRAARGAGHDGGAGDAQRRRQEGRHDGDVLDRRPLGRLHPGERGRRHGARRRRRRPLDREARGDDRRLLARPRHDRRAGRHAANALAGVIADVMAIGMINSKTTGARLIPAYGKKVGDWVTLGGLFGEGPVMAVSTSGNDAFVARGGRIPAPLQGLTN